ncbi:MAG: cytochrome c [Planctomycetaceae bacterium]|nr:cytochrome c [Planctomycetaceae bacterium]
MFVAANFPRRLAAALAAWSLAAVTLAEGVDSPEPAPRPQRSRIRSDNPRRELPTAPRPDQWDTATRAAFFADATRHLGPGEPRAAHVTPPAGAPEDQAGAAPAGADAPTGVRWSQLISRETLEDEVKQLSTAIAQEVRSPGAFRAGGSQQARLHFTLLAALFEVIGQYDGEVRWQGSAAAWAELFARAGRNCQAASDAAFNEARARSADLAELVRGGDVELPAASRATTEPSAAVMDRRPLMSRLELAQQERLGPWTANAAQFQRQQAEVQHEAELLAALAALLPREGFEFAHDEGFRARADELQAAAAALRKAAGEARYPEARSAVGAIQQSCEKCHADYRG